jgi:hypothetical protein
MVMLAEHYDFIIGGDPDRDTIDLAILDAVTGRVHRPVNTRPQGRLRQRRARKLDADQRTMFRRLG